MGEVQPDRGPANTCVCEVKGWSMPTGNIMGYNLYISSSSGTGYKKANDQPITDLGFKASNLECNKRFYFVLTSLTSDQPPVESKPSQEFSLNSQPESTSPAR
jgi:hypothetical protein